MRWSPISFAQPEHEDAFHAAPASAAIYQRSGICVGGTIHPPASKEGENTARFRCRIPRHRGVFEYDRSVRRHGVIDDAGCGSRIERIDTHRYFSDPDNGGNELRYKYGFDFGSGFDPYPRPDACSRTVPEHIIDTGERVNIGGVVNAAGGNCSPCCFEHARCANDACADQYRGSNGK